MPDTPAKEPDPNITDTITLSDSLSQKVMSLTETAAGKADAKGSSWPVYILLASVITIGLGVMGWLMVSARRKAAELAFQLRQKEEEQAEAVENQKLELNSAVRTKNEEQARTLDVEIQELKKDLQIKEDEAVARAATFAKIASWNDLIIVDKRQQ